MTEYYCIWWDGNNWFTTLVMAESKAEAKMMIKNYDYLITGDTPTEKSIWGYDNHYDLHIAEHNNKNAMEGLFRSIWD